MRDFMETDKKYACNARLGAKYSRSKTDFAVWSPYAEEVTLRLYQGCTDAAPIRRIAMSMDEKGVWRCSAAGNLDGIYYTYALSHGGIIRETPDIYGRSSGVNGERSMVFSPQSVSIDGWSSDKPVRCDSPADAIIYELHVRDFSMDEAADFTHRGKFLAFCESGITNSFGEPAGLDYISSLGVTHVHLLPVMDFASVDEAAPQFNWGYDPLCFGTPEGSYSTNPYDGHTRVRELRMLVKALHDRGLGVILDVVYNHTFSAENSPFSRTFPHYYYRHEGDEYSNGSGCGNELATERRMMSRFICDSLCTLARDYHLDGFRFDLMGLMDLSTLNKCARRLRKINPDIILYGEGWTGGCSPLPENRRALKHLARKTEGVAMFSDDLRDGIKGSVFDDRNRGFVNGAACFKLRELMKSVLCGGVFHPAVGRARHECWAQSPLSCINYVEAHDNLTFADKLTLSMPRADITERLRVNKLGAALFLLAQGVPFMQAGQELLRSKPMDGGFVHDSYNSPDSVNCLKWDNITRNRPLMEYYRGLIAIRRAHPELRMRSAAEIRERVRFESLSGNAFVMRVGGLLLAVNPNRRSAALKLGKGRFALLADADRAEAQPFGELSGRASVPPQGILLLDKL